MPGPRVTARWRETWLARFTPALLLSPSLLFLAVFFALPALGLVAYSVLTQSPEGTVGLPLTLGHYRHFFGTPLYWRVLLITLRISLCTTLAAALLAYPTALVITRSAPGTRRAITMIIAPLIVSVVVRTYGWELILANGPTGILNWLLLTTGLSHAGAPPLYRDGGRHRLTACVLPADGAATGLGARQDRPTA